MTAQQMNVDNIAHNLANANTVGLQDAPRAVSGPDVPDAWSSPAPPRASRPSCPPACSSGWARAPRSNEIIFTQGDFSQTDNPLDMVIQGRGFFQVRRPSGELAYTRAGSFHLDRDGNMVTSRRQPARAADHHSRRRPGRSRIAQDGTVSYTQPNQTAAQQAGQIQLANFPNPGRAEQPRRQSLYAHRRLGRPDRRHSRRPGRARHSDAGLHRAVQRLRGRGVHQPDRGAARLRGQLQSGAGRRRDVPAGQQPRAMIPLALLALAALPRRSARLPTRSWCATSRPLSRARESPARKRPIALAPAPGVQRRFGIGRAAPHRGALEPAAIREREVCVERPVAPLDPARVLDAHAGGSCRRRASRFSISAADRVPEGMLEFPLSGLRKPPAGAFWSGAVHTAGTPPFCRLGARQCHRLRAARGRGGRPQPPGRPIEASALRVETRDEFPSAEASPRPSKRSPARFCAAPIRAGTAIRSAWLEAAERRFAGRHRAGRSRVKARRWSKRPGRRKAPAPSAKPFSS